MRENFLHYLWKYKKFDALHLQSSSGEHIELVHVGQHNFNSGPDFFNAQLYINGQFWAGNVEIHVSSSDWYTHGHENDRAYENVILHVVWEHDTDISRPNGSIIPTLKLKDYVNHQFLANYHSLFNKPSKWINCENQFPQIDDFVIRNWLHRLYLERLEQKSRKIEDLLNKSNNDWEAVLFKLLAKNFGLKVNGDAFLDLAIALDFSIIRKEQSDLLNLEALFYGQAGMLKEEIEDSYALKLKKVYSFLKQKYDLSDPEITSFKFFRLRPSNFPTIRISQLANLYHQHKTLFSQVISTDSIKDYYKLFSIESSAYWNTHYNFGKSSKKTSKKLTKTFIDLMLINSIIPLKFSYAKYQGRSLNEQMIDLIQKIDSESNRIISGFNNLHKVSHSALQSQGLIHLKNFYCDKNKCLQCSIGHEILSSTI